MRKWILSFGFILIAFTSVQAQTTEPVRQESVLRLGLLGPNLEYEAKLSDDFTLVSEVGVTFALGYGGNEVGGVFEYALITKVSPRYYYNLGKRQRDGKSVHHYAGNYLSFTVSAVLHSVFSSQNMNNQYVFGPTWGLQRNLGEGWFFNFEIGPGLVVNKNDTDFGPIIGLDIGFRL